MSDQWFFIRAGQKYGPVSGDQLAAYAASGQLQPAEMVWTQGMPQWLPAAQIEWLAFARPSSTVPPVAREAAEGRVPLAEARGLLAGHQARCEATWLMGGIPAEQLEKARLSYASNLGHGETPLVLGKSYKVLITDRCMYAADMPEPVPLRKIVVATHSRFDLLKAMAEGAPRTRFLINGREVTEAATGTIPTAFLEPVLEGLGEVARRLAPPRPGEFSREDSVRIAAAAVVGGRQNSAVAARLAGLGADLSESLRMLTWMAQKFGTPNRAPGAVMVAGGLLGIGVCFAVAMLMKAAGSPVVMVLKGLGALGIFAVLAGLYRLVTGKSGLDEGSLADEWLRQQEPDRATQGRG